MLLHVNILRSILSEIMSNRLKLFSFIAYLNLSCIYVFFSKRVYARTYVRMSGHALVYPHQIEVKCLQSQRCVVFFIINYSILN